jgi:6-pyruvoyl-tetrahydropterin synthase
MYAVSVKDHIMIAHSLPDEFFGPAKNMHGATYVIEALFQSETLDTHNVVIDIGEAHNIVKKIVASLSYKNLDELPQFKNQLTTTEFLAKYIFDQIKLSIPDHIKLKVTLHESHVAYASYEG